MKRTILKLAIVSTTLALVASGCARNADRDGTDVDDAGMSIKAGKVDDEIKGNVATIPVDVKGFELAAPDGKKSEDRGHFHVFIDKAPVEVGKTIPQKRGIVHTADNPIKVYGLKTGRHELNVVVGDGTHQRFGEKLALKVDVRVDGPTVTGKLPSKVKSDEDVTVKLDSQKVEIKAADGASSDESGHFHVLIDPAEPPKAGSTIAPPEEGKIYHTAEKSVNIGKLKKGPHTLWVVLGDGTHKAFDPPAMDRVTFTVT